MDINEVKSNLLKKEDNLSQYATRSIDAIRVNKEQEDIRPAFFRDIDRIIHSNSYTRYIDKTQVFSYLANDHISKRSVHVQLVSKIARTIGRCLNLNEDLIEAIALGHDIGHTPLGHLGESILNDICKDTLNEYFMHNVQSVRTYLMLDMDGSAKNLSIQVLDGILCHNGEVLSNIYEPNYNKTKDDFFNEYTSCYKDSSVSKKIRPMTLEGCVVRISDVIAYIGRDIEDAIQIGLLKRDDIPQEISDILGNNNKDIINNIVLDIVENSYNKPYIKMSDNVYKSLFKLKEFNYEKIYNKSNTNEEIEYYRNAFNILFSNYLRDIEYNKRTSDIFLLFIDKMNKDYIDNTSKERIVIDFIAGMTDDFFRESYKKLLT